MAKISKLSVYDIQTKQFILDGVDRSVVMDKFNITTHTVSQYISRQYKLNGRYIICRQEEMGLFDAAKCSEEGGNNEYVPKRDKLIDDWNDTMEAIRILKNGGHIVKVDGKPHHVEAAR